MNLEEQIKLHHELTKEISELEEKRKTLGLLIMQQMLSKVLKINGFIVRRCQRLSIKLSLDEARVHNAVKLEECVDKNKIKELYKSGTPIKGVSETEYIQISLEKRINTISEKQ